MDCALGFDGNGVVFRNDGQGQFSSGATFAVVRPAEIAALPASVELVATIRLEVPRLDARRHLLLLRARG